VNERAIAPEFKLSEFLPSKRRGAESAGTLDRVNFSHKCNFWFRADFAAFSEPARFSSGEFETIMAAHYFWRDMPDVCRMADWKTP
jgi:hypothetical protein